MQGISLNYRIYKNKIMKTINLLVFFVLLFFGKTMPAQILSPVQSKYSLSKDAVKKGDELMIFLA